MRALSPRREHARVGVVPRNPESVTSSTVSPMERTRVALVKETTMYASYSSGMKEEEKERGEKGGRRGGKERGEGEGGRRGGRKGRGRERKGRTMMYNILVCSFKMNNTQRRRRYYHLHLLIVDLQEEQNGGHTLRVSTH